MNLLLWSLFLALIWGLTPLYSKYLMTNGHNEMFIMFLVGVVIVVFSLAYMLLAKINLKKEFSKFKLKSNVLYFLIWVLATFLVTGILYFRLLKYHSATLVNAIISIYPIITLIGAYYLLNEEFKPIYLVAIALIVAALVLINIK